MSNFGKVIGLFETFVVDNDDLDDEPQLQPLKGKITFTPTVPRVIDGQTPYARVLGASPFIGVLDSLGNLSTPKQDGSASYPYIKVLGNNVASFNPTNFEYQVSYALFSQDDRPVAIPTHTISVPCDSIVDLARLVPVPSAPIQSKAAAEASAAIAVTALSRAVRSVNGNNPDSSGNVAVSSSGGDSQSLQDHIDADQPHDAYDDMPDLATFYANRKAVQ